MAKERDKRALSGADALKKKWGNILVDPLGASRQRGLIRTGSLKIDAALNGGLRYGVMSMLWGGETGGKTTTMLSAARQVQKSGGIVDWIDAEGALDIGPPEAELSHITADQARARAWLDVNGINAFDGTFRIWQPETGEESFELMIDLVRLKEGRPSLIVEDSVAGMVPRRQFHGEIGDANYGALAALMSSALPMLYGAFVEAKNKETHIAWINQRRANVGAMHGGDKAYGGKALPHWCRQVLKITRIKDKLGPLESTTTSKVQVTKNAFGPKREVQIQFSSGRGLDTTSELLSYAVHAGYAQKSGNWYYLFETAEQEGDPIAKFNGEAATKQWMDDNDWSDKLYEEALASTEVDSTEVDEEDE